MITNVLKNKLPPHSNKAVLVYPVTLLKHVEASLPVFLPVGLCVAVTWCVCVCVQVTSGQLLARVATETLAQPLGSRSNRVREVV